MVKQHRYTDREKDILFILCVSYFLVYLFFLANDICIAFKLISSMEVFRESFFFNFFKIVRWIELLGILAIGVKGTYVSYRMNLPSKTPFYVIPLALIFIVLYSPFYNFLFSLGVWMIIDLVVTLIVLSGLIRARIK
ncbi:MAG TPA: hypothetical protein QF753_20140 [Victivallales bacterium]|nr:hypothetical protein [Victivallales bacterium]